MPTNPIARRVEEAVETAPHLQLIDRLLDAERSGEDIVKWQIANELNRRLSLPDAAAELKRLEAENGRLAADLRAYEKLSHAQARLLICYRTGNHQHSGKYLDAINAAESKLGTAALNKRARP